MKPLVLAVFILTLCVGGFLWVRSRSADISLPSTASSTKPVVKASRGDLRVVVSAEGRLRARNSRKVFHQVEGSLTIASIVPEGTFVKQGDELVVFDSAKQVTEVESAEAEYKAAETDVDIAQRTVEITQRENTEALSQAQFKYSNAALEYEKQERGDLPQQERKQKLSLEQAQSELKQSRESYEAITSKDVLDQGFVSKDEIEKARIRLRSAEINLELVTSDMEVFNKYTRPVTLNAKRADVETTKANVAMIENVNANKLRQKAAELEAKQEKLRQAKTKVENAKRKLQGTRLLAPENGMVLYGEQRENAWYDNEERIRIGANVSMNQTVITLPKTDEMTVKAMISEQDITKIKAGQNATITYDAYPGRRETGKVFTIGNVPVRNWMDGANTFEVVISLPLGDLGMKTGTSAKVEIEICDLKNVLTIPVNAVFIRDGRTYVYLDGLTRSAREVTLGESTTTHVAVTRGVSEGDSLLLYEPEGVELPVASTPPQDGRPELSSIPETPAR